MSDDATVTPDDIAVLRAVRSASGEIIDLSIVQASEALAQMVGTTMAAATGRRLLELLPWFDPTRFAAFVRVIETGTRFVTEYPANYAGIDRQMKITATSYDDGVMVVVRDVTVERDVAASFRQGNALFQAITQVLNDAVAVWSAVRDDSGAIVDLRYEYVNASAERLIGMPASDLLGFGLLERFPERREQGVFARYCDVIAHGMPTTIEVPWGVIGGIERVVEASVVRFGDGVVSAGREITAHKQTEAQLRASESRYRLLTDYACDGVIQYNRGIIEWVSPSATAHFGWSADDLVGRDLLSFLHPRDMGPALANRQLAAEGRAGERARVRLRCKDGTWNWVDYRSRPLPDDNGELGWMGVTTIWNVQAEVDALEALAAAERERSELEERLVQAQKLEAIGQLTGGVAHDFNNLLTVIVGGTEMLRDANPADPTVASLSTIVLGAAQRGADLTRRLLAFARRQTLQPTIVVPGALIEAMSELLRPAIGENISIEIARPGDEWSVSIDAGQFEAAVMNLTINARDALPDGGRLSITTSNVVLDTDAARDRGEVEPGTYVRVSVSDDGVGMSPDVLQHAFDPFFTTKESTRGSGLGLSTVYGFIKQSGGHVTIRSEVDRGTTVDMYLPRHEGDRTSSAVAMAEASPSDLGRGETVLVVEDDEQVRSLAVRLLGQLGYVVLEAPDGDGALDVLREGTTVDLLFSDVVMPGGLTGPQLALAARGLRPTLRVLYTSGYTENADLHRGMPGAELLAKPYLRAEFAAAIRRALDAPAPGPDRTGH